MRIGFRSSGEVLCGRQLSWTALYLALSALPAQAQEEPERAPEANDAAADIIVTAQPESLQQVPVTPVVRGHDEVGMDAAQAEATPWPRLSHLSRMARVSYLDPSIIRAILRGEQRRQLTARALWRAAELPLGWAEQRRALGLPQA